MNKCDCFDNKHKYTLYSVRTLEDLTTLDPNI